MNGLSNTAIRVHQVLQMPRHESLRMEARIGAFGNSARVERVTGFGNGGDAQ